MPKLGPSDGLAQARMIVFSCRMRLSAFAEAEWWFVVFALAPPGWGPDRRDKDKLPVRAVSKRLLRKSYFELGDRIGRMDARRIRETADLPRRSPQFGFKPPQHVRFRCQNAHETQCLSLDPPSGRPQNIRQRNRLPPLVLAKRRIVTFERHAASTGRAVITIVAAGISNRARGNRAHDSSRGLP